MNGFLHKWLKQELMKRVSSLRSSAGSMGPKPNHSFLIAHNAMTVLMIGTQASISRGSEDTPARADIV